MTAHRDTGDRGWEDAPGASDARRKLVNLLAGDFMLYEITADREMLVLRLPRRLTPRAAASCRAFPRADGAAPPGA